MCDINLFRNVIAFTNRNLSKRPYLEQIEKICSCHPKALVLREKDLPEKEYCMLAESVIKICKQYKVNCIIHNYIDTALKMNCNSIHLPLHILEKYHMYLKEFETIGTSVHSIQEAQKTEKMGVSYIVAGHIYNTDCKKGIPPRGLLFLEQICKNTTLPVYGIGGIQLNKIQIEQVIRCGAKGVCIMSEIMKM